jgi:hypothetical protein
LSHAAFSKQDAGGFSVAEAFLTFRGSGISLTEIYLEDGKTHNQIDHILIEQRWHLSKLMYDLSWELPVILNTAWWLQMLGKDWQ